MGSRVRGVVELGTVVYSALDYRLPYLGEAPLKKNVFFSEKIRKGGGLAESKISLSEKTEIFGFFCQKGGGSHLFQEGFYHKILIVVIKYSVFSSNTQFFFNFSKYFF